MRAHAARSKGETNSMQESIIRDTRKRPYQVCSCCVMDTTDDKILFDEDGVCMRCREYKKRILPSWQHGNGHEKELANLIQEIKESGKGKAYDCILLADGHIA